MNAPVQLQMFEPTGDDLAKLALRHLQDAQGFEKAHDRCASLGMVAIARMYAHCAEQASEQATVCEMALQFEQHAGVRDA